MMMTSLCLVLECKKSNVLKTGLERLWNPNFVLSLHYNGLIVLTNGPIKNWWTLLERTNGPTQWLPWQIIQFVQFLAVKNTASVRLAFVDFATRRVKILFPGRSSRSSTMHESLTSSEKGFLMEFRVVPDFFTRIFRICAELQTSV